VVSINLTYLLDSNNVLGKASGPTQVLYYFLSCFVTVRVYSRRNMKRNLRDFLQSTVSHEIMTNTHDLGRFNVMRISSHTRDWPASVKFHAADDAQFRVSVFYRVRDTIENRWYNTVRSPRPSLKWALKF
jgi:hypothetical protein